MTDPLTIRHATPADSLAYEAFMAALFAEDLDTLCPRVQTPTSTQVHAWLSTHTGETSVVLLAYRGEDLLGTLNLTRFARPHLDHTAGLGLNVRADARGQGVGRALLEAGLRWFRDTAVIERIELEVTSNNAPALHLYQYFGFVQEGRKLRAVRKGSHYLDLIGMALQKNAIGVAA